MAISPPIDGVTNWNLARQGDIIIPADGQRYTMTFSHSVSALVKMWGGGGGVASYGDSGDGGGAGFTTGTVSFAAGVVYYALAGTAGGSAATWSNGGDGGVPGGGHGTMGDASGAGGGGYSGLFEAAVSQQGAHAM